MILNYACGHRLLSAGGTRISPATSRRHQREAAGRDCPACRRAIRLREFIPDPSYPPMKYPSAGYADSLADYWRHRAVRALEGRPEHVIRRRWLLNITDPKWWINHRFIAPERLLRDWMKTGTRPKYKEGCQC